MDGGVSWFGDGGEVKRKSRVIVAASRKAVDAVERSNTGPLTAGGGVGWGSRSRLKICAEAAGVVILSAAVIEKIVDRGVKCEVLFSLGRVLTWYWVNCWLGWS